MKEIDNTTTTQNNAITNDDQSMLKKDKSGPVNSTIESQSKNIVINKEMLEKLTA